MRRGSGTITGMTYEPRFVWPMRAFLRLRRRGLNSRFQSGAGQTER